MSAQNYTYNGTIGDWMEEGDGGTPAVPQQHDPSSFPGATGTQQQQQQQQQKNSGVKKKRVRNWSADDRAAHRAFERSRREAFKERLVVRPTLKLCMPP